MDDLEFVGVSGGGKLLVTLDDDAADIEVGDEAEGTAVRISKGDALALAAAIMRKYHGSD
jgi:hypothetical protein